MKNKIILCVCFLLSICFFTNDMLAQQQTIEYDSDDQVQAADLDGPHLLLLEKNDDGSGGDGWSRLWFRNATDSDPLNRWSFLARPYAGATDNDGTITQPLVMAHRATQKFGFGSDGTLRINKQFVLPNMDGNVGEVMTTNGAGVVSWQAPSGSSGGGPADKIIDADMDSEVYIEEGAGTATDTINFNVGVGSTFTKVMKMHNGLIEANRRLAITANSTPTLPHIRLFETSTNDASRLFFSNSNSSDDWILTANSGTIPGNHKFAINYNGSARMIYDEPDSTLIALNRVNAHAPSFGASFFSFTNNQFAAAKWFYAGDASGADRNLKTVWVNEANPASELTFQEHAYTAANEAYTEIPVRLGIGTVPYSDGTNGFKLHVDTSTEPAAHFGPQSASIPAVGYVTINRPSGSTGNASVLRIRDAGSTVADFESGDIDFFEPTNIREDLTVINGDVDVTSGSITASDFLRLEPRTVAPACNANGSNNGTIYYFQTALIKKLRLCIDGSWTNLN